MCVCVCMNGFVTHMLTHNTHTPVWEISGRQVAMASEMTQQATSFFVAGAKLAISPSVRRSMIARDRERAKGGGARAGHCAYAYGSPCRDELGALWLLKQHELSNCLYLFTCGRSSLAGQRILRAPPVRASKIRTARKTTLAHVKRQRFNSAWKEGRETSR